jgi:hypothetical protein
MRGYVGQAPRSVAFNGGLGGFCKWSCAPCALPCACETTHGTRSGAGIVFSEIEKFVATHRRCGDLNSEVGESSDARLRDANHLRVQGGTHAVGHT